LEVTGVRDPTFPSSLVTVIFHTQHRAPAQYSDEKAVVVAAAATLFAT
jgi:hypothetical protein